MPNVRIIDGASERSRLGLWRRRPRLWGQDGLGTNARVHSVHSVHTDLRQLRPYFTLVLLVHNDVYMHGTLLTRAGLAGLVSGRYRRVPGGDVIIGVPSEHGLREPPKKKEYKKKEYKKKDPWNLLGNS